MESQYQVVLTGELLPGVNKNVALEGMARMFSATPDTLRGLFDGASHPLSQRFNAQQARAVQTRLKEVGVASRVERLVEQPLNLQLSIEGAASPNAAVPPNSPSRPPMDSGWNDFEDDEPDDDRNLGLFIGPDAQRYMRTFERFGPPHRPRLQLGWNWGAFFSPFLWVMYRKMWFWAFVTLITEVLVPMTIFLLDSRGVLIPVVAPIAWVLVALNRLIWPAIADYLYFRHTHTSIARLHRFSPTRAHESDIATTGGVSAVSSVVGGAVSVVLVLFIWSVIDAMGLGRSVFERGVYPTAVPREEIRDDVRAQRKPSTLAPTATAFKPSAPGNQWGRTRSRLRGLSSQINAWLTNSSKGADPTVLTLFKLRETVGVKEQDLVDAWGAEIQYIPDVEGYRLISAGPDQLFGTADDIQFRQILSR